jgi:hypothetical protein
MLGYYYPEGSNQDKTHRIPASWLILHHRVSPIVTKISDDDMSIEAHQEGESTQDSFGRFYGSLDIQLQVPIWHSVHLQVPDVHCRGGRKPRVADSRSSTTTSCAGIWKSSIIPGRSIYIKRGLLRLESLCRAILSLHHDISRASNRENHPPIFSWSIELIFGSNSWSGFHWRLLWDRE